MTTSKMIAGLMGPTLAAIALAMLFKFDSIPELAEQVSRDPALIFLSGVLLFVAGLAIVRAHNIWTLDWPVLVTILGWLAIVGGLVRMLFPSRLAEIATDLGDRPGLIIGLSAAILLIGGFLSFKGYSRR
ncbi:MAG: hypothetical protein WAU59_00985 [Rhodoplanes sp.]